MANRSIQPIAILFSFAMLGLMLAIGNTFWGPAFGPDLGAVPLAQIESGKLRKSRYYAQVSGYADPQIAVVKTSKQGIWHYFPLRSAIGATAPVQVIVACRQSAVIQCSDRPSPMTIHGYVAVGGNTGAFGHGREQLAAQGVKLARNVKTITYPGERDDARMMLVLIAVMAISSIFGAFQVGGGG
jgi:hypothetical protein